MQMLSTALFVIGEKWENTYVFNVRKCLNKMEQEIQITNYSRQSSSAIKKYKIYRQKKTTRKNNNRKKQLVKQHPPYDPCSI